jgi:hypothetical protein
MRSDRHSFFYAGALLLLGCASAAVTTPAGKTEAPGAGQSDGAFVLRGYVVDRQECPPCPADGQCEACEQFIIVSDKPDPTNRTMVAEGNLRVLVPSVGRFSLGAKVKLKVVATGNQPFQNDPCCSRIGPYIVKLLE